MIVEMKKVTVIARAADTVEALPRLKKLGAVHIERKSYEGPELLNLFEEKKRVEQAISIIENTAGTSTVGDRDRNSGYTRILKRIENARTVIRDTESRILDLTREIQRMESWGNIKREDVDLLVRRGYRVGFYLLTPEDKDSFSPETLILTLSREKKSRKIMAFTEGELPSTDPQPLEIPEKSIREMEAERNLLLDKKKSLESQLEAEAPYLGVLQSRLAKLDDKINDLAVEGGVEKTGELSLFFGFIPTEEVLRLQAVAREEGWGVVLEEPVPGDPVPTLIKNNPFVRIIKPVFDILGTLPGYFETDISFYFLLFFTVFFAMIIGDAGYGALFFVGTVAGHIATAKKKQKLPIALKLLYVLSLATMAWGTVTGNWFGSSEIGGLAFFRMLTIENISSFPALFGRAAVDNNAAVMYICFVLGVVQLSIACIKSFIDQLPELKSFAQLGWLFVIDGLYFLVLNLVVGVPFPQWASYLIAGGLLLILIFGAQEKGKSFLRGVLGGLGGFFNTFLDAISSFSNIISYIRLFAVGMASVAIASSFNSMAAPMLGSWAFPAAVLILVLGHGLNLAMGLLSVVVHGVRLNMLEFSGQLGLEWSGIPYEPFKERIEDSKQ